MSTRKALTAMLSRMASLAAGTSVRLPAVQAHVRAWYGSCEN